jgi:DNA-binding NarL/FixJ family response regulator
MTNSDSPSSVKILFLEDSEQDVEFMVFELGVAGISVVPKQVSSKKDFLDALESFEPHVILADYSLPMFNGMHAFRLFKERNLSIPFILVTGALTEQLAVECLSEGIDDFILKESFKRLPSMILRCLENKKAQHEKQVLSLQLETKNQELAVLKEQSEKTKLHELLSNREFEILCLIAIGKSIKEIADQLFLSPATVATYRMRVLEKMRLKSNVDITLYAVHNHLVD